MVKGEAMRKGALAFFVLVIAACGTAPRKPAVQGVAPASAPDVDPPARSNVAPGDDTSDDASDDGEDDDLPAAGASADPCPRNMVLVDTDGERRFCIDKYEASLVEVMPDGTEKAYPHYLAVDGHAVRAVSEPGVYPQGYVSEVQAQDACAASGKRLCSYPEWKTACMGPAKTTFPYGDARRAGVCHDTGKSAVVAVFGAKAVAASPVSPIIAAANARKSSRPAHVTTKGKVASTTKPRATAKKSGSKDRKTKKKSTVARATTSTRPSGVDFNVWTQLNDARLGQVEGALSRTGEHPECANGFGVVDMVGNLHEWVATDPTTARGTFAGGYYLDTSLNGDGCNYKTQAHAHDYHDYSTGFRCCADAK